MSSTAKKPSAGANAPVTTDKIKVDQPKPTSQADLKVDPKQTDSKQADARSPDGKPGLLQNSSQGSLQKSMGPLITIDNYDPLKFQHINSPRSLDAMKDLCVVQDDLRLKTADDLRGMFNLEDPLEVDAFKKCVEKHKLGFLNLKEKISRKRKEMIKQEEVAEKKRKEQELLKNKQLKQLDEEKKVILKQLEAEQKKKDEAEKKKKMKQDLEEKQRQDKEKGKAPQQASKSQENQKKNPSTAPGGPKDSKLIASTTLITAQGERDAKAIQDPAKQGSSLAKSQADIGSKTTRGVANSVEKKPIKLDEELKESSILVFLDKSTAHKDQLDINLLDRTKQDLERDKQRMKQLMQKQKLEILEMSQKRNPSAYKSSETLGNAKTRKIEHLYDLSRNPVDLMKERQQKEMESMMNYEIALQSMRKQREDFLQNKHNFLKGEQQYKEIVLEYNKKILEREKQLKEMQRKIDWQTKLYHVQRTRKVNELEREKMINKLTQIDNKAKYMKEDRQDYLASRKFMVQKLKKDLENMKAGLITVEQVEKKYNFLHDDKEFQTMMAEVKKELHPGTLY